MSITTSSQGLSKPHLPHIHFPYSSQRNFLEHRSFMPFPCLKLPHLLTFLQESPPTSGLSCQPPPHLWPSSFASDSPISCSLGGFALAGFSARNAFSSPLTHPQEIRPRLLPTFPTSLHSPQGTWVFHQRPGCLQLPMGACGCLIHVCLVSWTANSIKAGGHVCLLTPQPHCARHMAPQAQLTRHCSTLTAGGAAPGKHSTLKSKGPIVPQPSLQSPWL